jgi:hypothetical protein
VIHNIVERRLQHLTFNFAMRTFSVCKNVPASSYVAGFSSNWRFKTVNRL